MEISRRALILPRALAIVLLALALGVSLIERRSPLGRAIREGRPWPAWISARAADGSSALFWMLYDPTRRTLTVLHLPEDWLVAPHRTLGRARAEALKACGDPAAAERATEAAASARLAELSPEPAVGGEAGRLSLTLDLAGTEEPALAAARALKDASRSWTAWAAAARLAWAGLRAGNPAAADALLLNFELRRVPLESLRPAWMPADADIPALLARMLAPGEESDFGRTVSVEVLNAAGERGLAGRAAKRLRSLGVDVVSVGTAPRPRVRTVVYDRTGDFAAARRVLRALACRGAAVVTRVDHARVVDASVEIGPDCAATAEPNAPKGD